MNSGERVTSNGKKGFPFSQSRRRIARLRMASMNVSWLRVGIAMGMAQEPPRRGSSVG